MEYPAIFGRDAAGEILEVGEDVTDFRVGQRVIAYASTRDLSLCYIEVVLANVTSETLDKALQHLAASRNTCSYISMR